MVLRGGALDARALREDAITNNQLYGFYGISCWIPSPDSPQETLLATKLLKSTVVLRFAAADLISMQLELWDTGQAPHYDVVYAGADNPDTLVEALISVSAESMINPYYDPDGGFDR